MENVFHISDPNTDINGRGGDKISLDSLEPLKRPPNSFVLYKLHFSKIVSPELMSDQRKMNVEAAKYWRLMTEEEKGIWKDKANELWEEWRIESSKRPRIVVPAAAPKPPPTPEELWDMERRKWRRPNAATSIPGRSGPLRDDRPLASSPYPCARQRSRSPKEQLRLQDTPASLLALVRLSTQFLTGKKKLPSCHFT
ncbi:hypothetical protein BKA70DRAFT_1280790 [Coprinopsis sp. MPI-PUGE-AT-0042]|nr:hypothetical protein BKA70DRAFT_1280790 [Coprinopsis sp. MPI-PUGE-AT-0042]